MSLKYSAPWFILILGLVNVSFSAILSLNSSTSAIVFGKDSDLVNSLSDVSGLNTSIVSNDGNLCLRSQRLRMCLEVGGSRVTLYKGGEIPGDGELEEKVFLSTNDGTRDREGIQRDVEHSQNMLLSRLSHFPAFMTDFWRDGRVSGHGWGPERLCDMSPRPVSLLDTGGSLAYFPDGGSQLILFSAAHCDVGDPLEPWAAVYDHLLRNMRNVSIDSDLGMTVLSDISPSHTMDWEVWIDANDRNATYVSRVAYQRASITRPTCRTSKRYPTHLNSGLAPEDGWEVVSDVECIGVTKLAKIPGSDMLLVFQRDNSLGNSQTKTKVFNITSEEELASITNSYVSDAVVIPSLFDPHLTYVLVCVENTELGGESHALTVRVDNTTTPPIVTISKDSLVAENITTAISLVSPCSSIENLGNGMIVASDASVPADSDSGPQMRLFKWEESERASFEGGELLENFRTNPSLAFLHSVDFGGISRGKIYAFPSGSFPQVSLFSACAPRKGVKPQEDDLPTSGSVDCGIWRVITDPTAHIRRVMKWDAPATADSVLPLGLIPFRDPLNSSPLVLVSVGPLPERWIDVTDVSAYDENLVRSRVLVVDLLEVI